jgi:thiol-disulfide isomerase/thioredoxin
VSDPGADGPPRRFAGVLLAVAFLGLCAAGGFLAYRVSYRGPAGLYPAATVAAAPGRAEDDAPATPPARRIPEVLPPLARPGPDGVRRALANYAGRLLVVNFWATWCEPCRREIPLLQKLRSEHAKDGVEIVGIALDHREDVAKYARSRNIAYPLLIAEEGGLEAVNAFGMDTVLPFSVFADRSGRIVTLKVGELHPDEAEFILGRLVDLDQGRLTLAQAREQIAAGISRLNAARPQGSPGLPN